jgi:molybdate transport system permease protein
MDWEAITLSLRLSACTTAVLVCLGIPLAWWLGRTRWRGRHFIEAIVALPIVLPPTVLGYYVLIAIGPHSPLGRMYESVFGYRLPFTFEGLLVASVLYSLPFAVQPFMGAFATLDRRLLEASWSLGESRLRTFFRVALPLSWPGVMSGIVLSFAHTMGEFGVVLMVGGNLRGQTRTISISIYDHVQALDHHAANMTSLAMLVFSFVVLFATFSLQRRYVHSWFTR